MHIVSGTRHTHFTQQVVLDHNDHADRAKYKNKSGDEVYYQKYRKASKVWDATPAVLEKEYKYIPALMKDILDYRHRSTHTMKSIPPLPPEHPFTYKLLLHTNNKFQQKKL